MNGIDREVEEFSRWASTKQTTALKRIMPRAKVEEVLLECGQENRHCRRLPKWFMVWFVLGLGLFGRDAYRQVCRWLRPFAKDGVPGRSTVCEARSGLACGRSVCCPHASCSYWAARRRRARFTRGCG